MDLTLPDGSVRAGQVLEVQGKKAVVQVRILALKKLMARIFCMLSP